MKIKIVVFMQESVLDTPLGSAILIFSEEHYNMACLN